MGRTGAASSFITVLRELRKVHASEECPTADGSANWAFLETTSHSSYLGILYTIHSLLYWCIQPYTPILSDIGDKNMCVHSYLVRS